MSKLERDWGAIAARILSEHYMPVSKLAKTVQAERGRRGLSGGDDPGRRGHVSASTLIRWIVSGKEGVYLDGVRLAGETWYSSSEALVRFTAALSERSALAASGGATSSRTENEAAGLDRMERARRATEELKKMRV